MKKIILVLGVLIFSLVFSATTYAGTVTGQLQVSATVVTACTVSTTAVNFGNVTGVSDYVNATADVTVNCSNGLSYHIALDAGTHYPGGYYRNVAGSGYQADYEILKPSENVYWGDAEYARTYLWGSVIADTGNGSDQAHTARAYLHPFSGIPAGTVLTDTVTVTVHY